MCNGVWFHSDKLHIINHKGVPHERVALNYIIMFAQDNKLKKDYKIIQYMICVMTLWPQASPSLVKKFEIIRLKHVITDNYRKKTIVDLSDMYSTCLEYTFNETKNTN